jgi:hypothetical protein
MACDLAQGRWFEAAFRLPSAGDSLAAGLPAINVVNRRNVVYEHADSGGQTTALR